MPAIRKKDRDMVFRVLDAVTHDMRPGVATLVLYVYLGRKAQAEIEALFRTRRREAKRAGGGRRNLPSPPL